MTTIARVRVQMLSFAGAPGVMTFYGLDGPTLLTPLHAMFTALKPIFPEAVQLQIEDSGDLIDAAKGTLTGSWTGAPVLPIFGTAPGPYSAPSGPMIRWNTAEIRDGHHVRGRTFLVPGAGYDNTGTIDASYKGTILAAAQAFVTAASPSFIIWHRFRAAHAATATRPALTERDGSAVLVVGADVSPKVAVLRSRRD